MTQHLPPAVMPAHIKLTAYPELQWLAWNRPRDSTLTPDEAFALYERNWHFVEQGRLSAAELALIEQLVASVGRGVFLV